MRPTETISAIAAGLRHSLILRSDETAWMWGWGYPINGHHETVARPSLVQGIEKISTASPGGAYPLFVKTDGTVCSRTGKLFDSPSDAVAGSTGMKHSIILAADGRVWAWGDNQYGQVGTGNLEKVEEPICVEQLEDVRQVSAGWFHSLALDNQGILWGWGWNNDYQLATDAGTNITLPVAISHMKPGSVNSISAGAYHNAILLKDGTVWTWGFYEDGDIEDDGEEVLIKAPIQVDGLPDLTSVVAGWSYSLALDVNGNVWGWGRNDFGQLGNGSAQFSMIPSRVKGLDKVVEIAAGGRHALALKQDGSLWGWGANIDMQLKPNASEKNLAPVRIE